MKERIDEKYIKLGSIMEELKKTYKPVWNKLKRNKKEKLIIKRKVR